MMCVCCCLKSGLFVLHAGGPTQPGGEALRRQSLRADAHAGAHASRDAQAAVRRAARCLSDCNCGTEGKL